MSLAQKDAVPRLEAALKVTGAARYAAERHVPGLLHAALTLAPIASGEILQIDASKALALGGVVSVLTHENALRIVRPGVLLPSFRLLLPGRHQYGHRDHRHRFVLYLYDHG